MKNKLTAFKLALATLCTFSLTAFAAPTQTRSFLPIGEELVKALKNNHDMSEEDVSNFVIELNKIAFYADHKNPSDISKLDDPKTPKIYYMAPFFQPSGEREVVADIAIATNALGATRAIDELVNDFSFRLNKLRSNRIEIENLKVEIKKLVKEIAGEKKRDKPNQTHIKNLEAKIADYRKDVKRLQDDIQAIYKNGSAEYDRISEGLKEEIVGNFIYGASRLGVAATEEEMTKLRSKNGITVLGAMAQIRLRVTKGQFGVRNVIVEAGLTEKQMKVLSLYRSIRTDVKIENLPVSKVYVKSTSQTSNFGDNKEQGFMQLRDINRSSENDQGRGLCGSISTCNVTIEYTEQGAETTNATRVNAVLLPLVFVGDAKVSIPDFKGRFECKFRNGWWAKGRADVKDGWIIYDGDVYNKIHYTSLDKMENCKVKIEKGDKSSAAATLLMELSKYYQNLFNARTQRSASDMNRYREKVQKDVDRHARESQKNKGNWVQYSVSWARGTMSGWGAVVTTFVTMARNYYWHTRIEDTKVESVVEINKEFDLENMVDTIEFAFDGYPAICHKKDPVGLGLIAVACAGEVKSSWNNEVENYDNVCPDLKAGKCEDRIKREAIENEEGFLVM